VPNLDALPTLRRADIEATIDRSLRRLGVERLDLVQLHWWDLEVAGAVDAALHLTDIQREGKIHKLGLTNFDTPSLVSMLDAGVPVVTHQVQLSLLDRRALGAMARACAERGVSLLAFGALAGGFVHERWLGAPPPDEPLENRSLVKYRLIIEEFGGWESFQQLLAVLGRIAARHATSIGSVALRWVLDQPTVAAVIVGARHAGHLEATLDAVRLALTGEERALLDTLVASAGPHGDVYTLERDKGGRHAAVMRYNLNR
jgi:aryl-alcohol dehydrogenase-like predicted oxidoreductase